MIANIAARKLLQCLPKPSLPIQLSEVCSYLGVEILYREAPTDFFDALYVEGIKSPTQRIIIVNDNFPFTHQRYSVAHEIGHIVMDHGSIGFLGGKPLRDRESWQEVHANQFAAELLMPKSKLVTHGVLTPQQISAYCNVSLRAAEIRAEELGWTQYNLGL